MKKYSIVFLVAAALFLSQTATGRVIKLLTIGNSFSDDAVEQYLYELAAEGGDSLIIGDAYRGGQGYESHWHVVEQQAADFEYRKIVGGKKTNERRTLLQCLEDEPWDIITFQQVSQDSGDYTTYEPWLTKLINLYASTRLTRKCSLGCIVHGHTLPTATTGDLQNMTKTRTRCFRLSWMPPTAPARRTPN